MSFKGQEGITCDGPGCGTWIREDVEYPWNALAAEDGENYYFCRLGCLHAWADLYSTFEERHHG